MKISIPVGAGELIDKITILTIKSERITDEAKLVNIRHELALLVEVRDQALGSFSELPQLQAALQTINEALWKIEDDIRDRERADDFGPKFIELARAVYVTNDRRAKAKRSVDEHVGSPIVEEKSYAEY
jgi:hypothetical protein